LSNATSYSNSAIAQQLQKEKKYKNNPRWDSTGIDAPQKSGIIFLSFH
jgi:hypothetical protein